MGEFIKPMVTIELAEYEQLKKRAQERVIPLQLNQQISIHYKGMNIQGKIDQRVNIGGDKWEYGCTAFTL